MFSLEPELVALRDSGALTPDAAAHRIARERREVVSVHAELRLLIWAGVMLIAGGVATLVAKHLDQLGPVTIASGIGAVSIGCYASCLRRRRAMSLVDDYVLLLAALLASSDVAYLEHHYHLLGNSWPRHFLFLAVLHGATAYLFRSRLVLTLSISALAAWIGVERGAIDDFASIETAVRALVCAAIVLAWRFVNRVEQFAATFEHAAANLGFWGALMLTFQSDTRLAGCAVTLVFAVVAAVWGRRTRTDLFVIYAWVYGTIAIDVVVCHALHEVLLAAVWLLASTIAAIAGIFMTRRRA
jgi:hypothetical protein